MVDLAIDRALTGTVCPSHNFPMSGVKSIAPMVVMVVINTGNARSPLPMNVHKLLAAFKTPSYQEFIKEKRGDS